MSQIELKEISPENYSEAQKLAVRDDQDNYVAPIQKSLADAFVYPESIFRLAYFEEQIVGYTLVFVLKRDEGPLVNIVRLMIDQRFQGQGLGRALLNETVRWIKTFDPPPDRLRISVVPENEVALKLYKSVGFEEKGIEHGEIALYMRNGQG